MGLHNTQESLLIMDLGRTARPDQHVTVGHVAPTSYTRSSIFLLVLSSKLVREIPASIQFPEDGQHNIPVHGLGKGEDTVGPNSRVDDGRDVQ